MKEEIYEIAKRNSFAWVKDEEGNTWLCPKSALKDPEKVTEDDLKECVDESQIPGEGG